MSFYEEREVVEGAVVKACWCFGMKCKHRKLKEQKSFDFQEVVTFYCAKAEKECNKILDEDIKECELR